MFLFQKGIGGSDIVAYTSSCSKCLAADGFKAGIFSEQSADEIIPQPEIVNGHELTSY